MHYDFALTCREPVGPSLEGPGARAFRLLAAHVAAGRRCAAFVAEPPSLKASSALSDRVIWIRVSPDRLSPSANMGGAELNFPLALCESIVAFLRDHSVHMLEFSAAEGDGFYFISHNIIHRLVPEVVVRLDPPGFITNEDKGERTCTLHQAFVYAGELEAIRGADHVLYEDEHLLGRVLAAFDPRVAHAIRARCVSSPATPDAADACFGLARPPIPPAPPARLGVVIPHWEDADHLAVLLARLEAAPEPERLEIVVVDDGSSGPVRQRLVELGRAHPRVKFLRTDKDRSGPFVARRIGVLATTTDVIALVDSDDIMEPAFYLRYAQALAQDPAIDVIIPAMHTFGRETRPWIPLPKARFTAYFTGFAHTGLVSRKAPLLAAFAHAFDHASGIAHAEDCILSLSLLFGGANIISLSERAYHYRRAHANSRSQSNGNLIPNSRLARDRHFDRCMSEALAGGSLTPLDLRLVRQIALSLPPDYNALQLHSRGIRVPWHTHAYRALRSLLRDPRYHP